MFHYYRSLNLQNIVNALSRPNLSLILSKTVTIRCWPIPNCLATWLLTSLEIQKTSKNQTTFKKQITLKKSMKNKYILHICICLFTTIQIIFGRDNFAWEGTQFYFWILFNFNFIILLNFKKRKKSKGENKINNQTNKPMKVEPFLNIAGNYFILIINTISFIPF